MEISAGSDEETFGPRKPFDLSRINNERGKPLTVTFVEPKPRANINGSRIAVDLSPTQLIG